MDHPNIHCDSCGVPDSDKTPVAPSNIYDNFNSCGNCEDEIRRKP